MGILCLSLEESTLNTSPVRSSLRQIERNQHGHPQVCEPHQGRWHQEALLRGPSRQGHHPHLLLRSLLPAVRGFTPILKDFYEEVDGVEIIFVSSDQSQDAMVAYMKESHGDWWAVEYGSDPVKALKEHFGVSGIPMLVVLNKDGKLITKDGRGDVSGKGPASVAHWKKA